MSAVGQMQPFPDQEKPGTRPGSPEYANVFRQSCSFEITSRQFATLGDNLVTDTLTFGQCVHAGVLYSTDVHENVFLSGFRLDKSKPFTAIEEFNSSYSHGWPPKQKSTPESWRSNEQSGCSGCLETNAQEMGG
jgi:hypothetical protein